MRRYRWAAKLYLYFLRKGSFLGLYDDTQPGGGPMFSEPASQNSRTWALERATRRIFENLA